jgi:hypothetical protein
LEDEWETIGKWCCDDVSDRLMLDLVCGCISYRGPPMSPPMETFSGFCTYPARHTSHHDLGVPVIHEPARQTHVSFAFVSRGCLFAELGGLGGHRQLVSGNDSNHARRTVSHAPPGTKHTTRPRARRPGGWGHGVHPARHRATRCEEHSVFCDTQ